MNRIKHIFKRNTIILQTAVSTAAVISISGLIEIYGLFDTIYFNKGVISVATFFLFMKMFGIVKKDWTTNKRAAGTAFILSWLLTFTEIFGIGLRLAVNGQPVRITPSSILWMAASSLFLSLPGEIFFFWLLHRGIEAKGTCYTKTKLNRVFLISWLVVFCSYIPCFLAFYPGLFCYDMIWQWDMFNSGVYNTHHPLIHTLFSGGLIEIGNGIFGSYNSGLALHSIVQLLILSASIAFAIRYLFKIRIPKKICIATIVFYIAFPFFPVLGISTTKDVIFGSLLLVVFICICDMVTNHCIYRGYHFVFFCIVTILMGLFRNNAVYSLAFTGVCFLFIYVVLLFRKKTSRLLLNFSIILLCLSIGISGACRLLEKGLHANQGSVAEMLSIPCQQLARTYVYHGSEMAPSDKEKLTKYISEDALTKYKYYVSDPVKAGLDVDYLKKHKKEFIQLWFKIGKQFSGEYLLAPIYNTMGLWYMGGDSSCYVVYHMSPPFDEKHVVSTQSILPSLRAGYSWFTDTNIQKSLPVVSLLFYTSFYAWVVIICIAILIERRKYLYLIPSAILLSYMLTLIPGPCTIIRYMMGIMLCVPILVSITFYRDKD